MADTARRPGESTADGLRQAIRGFIPELGSHERFKVQAILEALNPATYPHLYDVLFEVWLASQAAGLGVGGGGDG